MSIGDSALRKDIQKNLSDLFLTHAVSFMFLDYAIQVLGTPSQVEQPRSYTTVYGKIRRNTWASITIVFFRVVYDDIRQHTEKNTTVYGPRIQSSYTIFVSLRTSPYMIVSSRIRLRRHTIVILAHVLRHSTIVYGACLHVYGRKRAYMDCVSFDLGSRIVCGANGLLKAFVSL